MSAEKKELWLKAARHCVNREQEALNQLTDRLDDSFVRAVELLVNHSGKVVISGIGKSAHIGQKIASTLCSTGTSAVFMHAAEATHGDLGIYQPGDPTILISKSGSTAELVRLIPILKDFQSPIISIVGNLDSELARCSNITLNASVTAEADPLALVPTASTLVTLAMGDALASALMAEYRFEDKDFARFHPSGQLGRNLLSSVKNVMRGKNEVSWIRAEMSLREIVISMTKFPEGAACVVSEDYQLEGIVTDGDIRRCLEDAEDINELKAVDIMKRDPITTYCEAPLADALKLMEDRPRQISVLPVLEKPGGACCGLLRIHDVYQPQW